MPGGVAASGVGGVPLRAGRAGDTRAKPRRKRRCYYGQFQECFGAEQSGPESTHQDESHRCAEDGTDFVTAEADSSTVVTPTAGDGGWPDDRAQERHSDNEWLLGTQSGAVQ